MFKKTYRNIYSSLMLTATLLIILIETSASFIVSNMIYENCVTMASQKLDRSISACKNYVNSVLLSAGNLALDDEIISEVQTGKGKSITYTLDNACNYAIKINAITVYSLTGKIYRSSKLDKVPTLEMLYDNSRLNDFFSLEITEYVSLRTDNIPGIYDNTNYNTDMGIVSCCQKIYNNQNKIIGYIFADIFPSTLYQFFNYYEDLNFTGSIPVINFDNEFFIYKDNINYSDIFSIQSAESFKSEDGNYLILPSARNFFGGIIKVAVPLSSIKKTISEIIFLFVMSSAIILAGVHFIAKNAAKNINGRLENLLKKMEKEGYRFNE